MARRRRKARRNPRRRARRNPTRGRRRARRNPARGRRRRARRNPGSGVFAREAPAGIGIYTPPGTSTGLERVRAGGKPKRRKTSARVRASRALRRRRNKVYRQRAKGLMSLARSKKRGSYARASLATQARRYRTLTKVKGRSVRKSPVYKAMHLKANPGLAGVLTSAKVLLPQGAVGAGAMVLLAMGGRAIAARVPTASLGAAAPYVPAVATLGLTGLGYVIADKVAPKFKGAVAIGGIIGAILLAVGASSYGARVKSAFGVGEYTMVGGGGIFRGDGSVGEYTMVGSGGDNSTEFAHDSLRGTDDSTDFAPGEGGVLSGSGIFRT